MTPIWTRCPVFLYCEALSLTYENFFPYQLQIAVYMNPRYCSHVLKYEKKE